MINFEHVIALDLERACWTDRSPGEIIQIGLAVLDAKSGSVIKTRSDYIKPIQDDISEFCTKLTGISQKRLDKSGRDLNSVLQSIYAKVGCNKLYVTWGDDMGVVKKYCQERNIDYKFNSVLDLSLLFHFKLAQEGQHLTSRIGLEKAMNMMGLEFDGTKHNAEVDAKNTALLAYEFFKTCNMAPTINSNKLKI